MNQQYFTYEQLIAGLAKGRGYSPRLDRGASGAIFALSPNVVLISPTMIKEKSGRERCRITSVVEFVLIRNGAKMGEAARFNLWKGMKGEALEMILDIENSPYVVQVSGLTISSYSRKEGLSDEVAVKVCATVVSNYSLDSAVVQLI